MHPALRIDPTLKTISEVDAKYGFRVDKFYGASFDTGVPTAKQRSLPVAPLNVTTVLLGDRRTAGRPSPTARPSGDSSGRRPSRVHPPRVLLRRPVLYGLFGIKQG